MAKSLKQSDVSPGAVLAEYIGTFTLAFAVLASVNGVLASAVPTPVIAGVTLALMVLSIGGFSGAHINPAITAGLWSIRKIEVGQALSYIVAQIAGAFSAAAIMNTFLEGNMITVAAGEVDMRVFFAEMVGAMFFSFGVAAAVHNQYKGTDAALVVGGSLFLGIVAASVLSNAILNPAVAFALNSVSPVYLLAPVAGSFVGMNLYSYIKSQS
jgi:glycerol uptake facilitator-like aquaporin